MTNLLTILQGDALRAELRLARASLDELRKELGNRRAVSQETGKFIRVLPSGYKSKYKLFQAKTARKHRKR